METRFEQVLSRAGKSESTDAASAFADGFAEALEMAVESSLAIGVYRSRREAIEALFAPLASDEESGSEFVEAALESFAKAEGAPSEDAERLQSRGLEAAAVFLLRQGYDILEKGWTSPSGDVADIVAYDPNGAVVFVEVVTTCTDAGMPMETATAAKRRRVEALAIDYLSSHEIEDGVAVRFDAIAITKTQPNKALLRHHVGCFDNVAAA